MVSPTPPVKSGVKTTEFWTSIPGAAGCLELARQVPSMIDDPLVQGVTVGICVVGAVFLLAWYTAKRTEIKQG